MEKEKKPFYKRLWFIIIAVIMFIGFVTSMGDDKGKLQPVTQANIKPTPIAENNKTESSVKNTESVTPVKVIKSTPKPTIVPTSPVPSSAPAPIPARQTDRTSVLAVLKSNASSKWGDNYEMVKYEYDKQVEAYDWVVAQTKYPDIMNKAKQKWVNNYEMVKYEYDKQVEAYEWVIAQTQYPSIMAKAKQKWGTNYEMVQYEYDKQVEAFQSL